MDPERLGSLIDRHADALELYARQWCEIPEDVVQEAFVKLAERSVTPDDPAAWLFRVVRNGALNASTAARRRRRHESNAQASRTDWFEPSGSESGVDPEAVANELESLEIDQREVIVAHVWGGLSFEQIGQIIKCSSSSAHRLYHAGLEVLRERLGGGLSCRVTKSRVKGN